MKNQRWSTKDSEGWTKLGEAHCYPDTHVWVYPVGDKQWKFKVVNRAERPMHHNELARRLGEAVSKRTWKSREGAKAAAESTCFRRNWLETAGITFKDDDDEQK